MGVQQLETENARLRETIQLDRDAYTKALARLREENERLKEERNFYKIATKRLEAEERAHPYGPRWVDLEQTNEDLQARLSAAEKENERLSSNPDWTAYNALQDERDGAREACANELVRRQLAEEVVEAAKRRLGTACPECHLGYQRGLGMSEAILVRPCENSWHIDHDAIRRYEEGK